MSYICLFLSTPSARRATKAEEIDVQALEISIHALREEGDELRLFGVVRHNRFLSTPSARRATSLRGHFSTGRVFLSTPSARRATSG